MSPRLPYFTKTAVFCFFACFFALLLTSVSASAASQGAAFTTFDTTQLGCLDGMNPKGVDCHNYAAKEDVYIDGGPRGGQGDLSAGCYYFVVLNPGAQNGGTVDGAGALANGNPSNLSDNSNADGDVPLGDVWTNRIFHVGSGSYSIDESYSPDCGAGGGTPHLTGTDPSSHTIIQLFPYDDTGNPAGEYSVGVCEVLGSDGSPYVKGSGDTPNPSPTPDTCKFDAFKVKKTTTTCTSSCAAPATIGVCKFWDVNLEHVYDNDPFIGAWPVFATYTDNGGYPVALSANTDNTVSGGNAGPGFGCATFTITFDQANPQPITVTLTEGNSPGTGSNECDSSGMNCSATPASNWQQSAPYDFVNNKVLTSETVTVNPGDSATADDFGNFIGQDLTVTKTASPTFTRTYTWSISKSVDKTLVEQIGGTATFNYTVVASETGFTDSAWQVTGTITVTNPNGFDVTGVNVADSVTDSTTVLDANASCSVTNGTNATIAAGKSVDFSYTCTYSGAPSANQPESNTAIATWDKTKFATPDNSASGTFNFSFTTPTSTLNKTITVTDCFNAPCPTGTLTTLGTLTATDSSPFATATYKYSHTVNVPANNCVTYPNTATIVETGQTANASVEVCGPAKTGALTMGFWQNKNGQGIIKNYCGGTSGTSLHMFLTSFHPFSDETATTCSGEATYVYNVIKAAVCTSTSKTCNSMLKAQMLATALDVYFSDAVGLGGNRIGAPGAIANAGGIGTVSIDLTKVCNMIDGTGGTATCSGTFSNVASLFGVTKCDTVLAMLTYQNTSDPLSDAGAVWYGQVKANQVGAKNAFDAINNQVAFGCP
jgi:hypothetical protein